VADVGQGKDRLATVTFTVGHGRDGAGRGDGILGAVADAVRLDPGGDGLPVQRRAAPVVAVGRDRAGRRPLEILRVVETAADGRERAALAGQLDAGAHGVEAHKLHDLPGQLLPLFGTVAHAQAVHDVGQAHDPQADAPHAMGRLLELRHGRHVGIGRHHVVQKAGRLGDGTLQLLPVQAIIGGHVAGQVDRA